MKNTNSGTPSSTILPVTVTITRSGSPPVPAFAFSGNGVGSDGQIDLSNQPEYVLILFTGVSSDGDTFASDPIAVEKITGSQPVCPAQGSPLPGSTFKNPALDPTQTMLCVSDHNTGGGNSGYYQYALFFTAAGGDGFSCDPKIINK
jgi:hypothetical protein